MSGGEDSGAGLKSGGELKVSSLLELAQGGADFTTLQCQLFLRCWWRLNAVVQELKILFYLLLREDKEGAVVPKQSRPFSGQC